MVAKKAVIVIIFSFFLMFSGCLSKPSETISYNFNVVEPHDIGPNVDTNALNFGSVGPGSSVTRFLTLTNTNEKTCSFSLSSDGEASRWLFVPDPKTIKSFESEEFEITLKVPFDARKKHYLGNVFVFVKCR